VKWILVFAVLLLPAVSRSEGLTRGSPESAQHFAERVVPLRPDADSHVLETRWNGRPVIFVDVAQGQDRRLLALEQAADGSYRKLDVTTAEEEGGLADVAAIGFADHGAAQRLIVILTWPVQHADVSGTLYEVRIFEDAKPGETKLTFLKALSDRFSANSCDCDRGGGKAEHYRFKTIASVKAELKRLGL